MLRHHLETALARGLAVLAVATLFWPMRMATALATIVLTLGLGATAQAGTTTNLITANKLASNKLASNKLASNKLAANGVSATVSAGEGAVADILGIELPDGTSYVR